MVVPRISILPVILLGSLLFSAPVEASGNVRISWTQEQDCEFVDHWELEINHVPAADLDGACGGTLVQEIHVGGVGLMTFRLRAVTADDFYSAYSNEVAATLPLAAPALTAIEIR